MSLQFLNRCAIAVRPKGPYLSWIVELEKAAPENIDSLTETYGSIYLIEELETELPSELRERLVHQPIS